MVGVAALTTELLVFKNLISTPFIWVSAWFCAKRISGGRVFLDSSPWLASLATRADVFKVSLGNTPRCSSAFTWWMAVAVCQCCSAASAAAGSFQVRWCLGLAAWFKWLTTVGLTSLLELVLKHFLRPLIGAYTFSKPQNRRCLKGTARFVGTRLSTCCVEQKGSQLSCHRVWSCSS